jgi:hypothetical protein
MLNFSPQKKFRKKNFPRKIEIFFFGNILVSSMKSSEKYYYSPP